MRKRTEITLQFGRKRVILVVVRRSGVELLNRPEHLYHSAWCGASPVPLWVIGPDLAEGERVWIDVFFGLIKSAGVGSIWWKMLRKIASSTKVGSNIKAD